MLFTFYPNVWRAVGTDYVDGPGLAYYLLALAFVTKALRTERPQAALAAAGAAVAATLYTNLSWLPFAPVPVAYYLYLRRPQTLSAGCRQVLESVRWLAAGAIGITALLCLANHAVDGRFWFYAPSVQWGVGNVAKPNPWKAANYEWLGRAHWLLYPGIALLTTLIYGIRRVVFRNGKSHRATEFFVLQFWYCLALWIAIELKGLPFLELPYYVSYLIPATFLVLTPLLFFFFSTDGASGYLISVAAAVILFVPWSPAVGPLLKVVSAAGMGSLLVFGACAIVTRALLPEKRATLIAGLIGFSLINLYLLGPMGFLERFHSPRRGEDAFIRMTQTIEDLDRSRHGQRMLFWYNLHDPNIAEFDSINSFFLWGYTWIGREFPAISPTAAELLKQPGMIAVLSTRDDAATLMRQAAGALQPHELIPGCGPVTRLTTGASIIRRRYSKSSRT